MTEETELDIRIDQNRLDEEWVNQPSLYFRYAAKLASARREVDEAKSDLELTRAEVDQSIRSSPGSYGLSKVTEKAIESVIPTVEDYRKALDAFHLARHTADVLDAAVRALDHRKQALEGLVKLFLANYFSRPQAEGETREKMKEVERKSIRRGRKRSEG